MRFLRLDLLTLLISLFILAGCKNPDSIGLGVDPSKALEANLLDSTTISTTTALDDTIATSSTSAGALAYFKDPTFGTTEANLITAVSLPGEGAFTALTDPPTIDSAVLILNYLKGAYGDLTTNYTVNVYQLNEPIVSTTYYNNKAWNVSPTSLGSLTFVPHPNDSIKVTTIVTGGPDTLIKVPPQIRIKISPNFIYNNFFNASASALATNAVFQSALKGLFITLNKTTTSPAHPGGTLFFNMTTPEIAIYYRVKHVSAPPDTVLTALPLSTQSGTPHAGQIKHDYSINPDIVSQLANPNTSASTVYMQGLSGLRTKLAFPYMTGKRLLHDIRKSNYAANPAVDTNGIVDYAINQAELRITPVAGTGIPFPPLPRITLYRFDIAHQRTYVPDGYSADPRYLSVGSFGGFFDPYHQSYSFIVTGYVDDLLRGKLKDYGTYIAPADSSGLNAGTVSSTISNSASFDGRSVIGGNKTSAYKMKLNILYSKVTK